MLSRWQIVLVVTVLVLLLVLGVVMVWWIGFGQQANVSTPEQSASPLVAVSQIQPQPTAVGIEPGAPTAVSPANAGTGAQVQTADASLNLVQAVASDATLFNPVLATGPTSLAVIDKLFPRLLGQDPNGGFITPTELALRWEISPDGRTYTFHLRDNIRWSDGQPVTATDVQYTYTALAAAQVQSPYADYATNIERMEASNPNTLVVTLRAPDCTILHSLRHPLLPSHRFDPNLGDIATHELNRTPTISAGPFRFVEWRPGEQIVLARNPDYWKGTPQIDRWILQVIPDAGERWARLMAGDVDLLWLTPEERVELALSVPLPPGVSLAEVEEIGYHFLALNLADPANPQPGQDANGVPLPVVPHPILGDLEVRRALAQALDLNALLAAAYPGVGTRQNGYIPAAIGWAHDASLAPMPTDIAAAQARLDAAGWVHDDGDGIRAKEGRPLQLSLLTNDDNPQRVQMGALVAAQLARVGFNVKFVPGSFEQVTAELLAQRFDLVLIGWENLHADPGLSPFWHSREDVPGAGYNFTSFADAEVDRLLDEASQLPGCNLDERGQRYRQVELRVADQLAYLVIGGGRGAWAYDSAWQNVAPGPWSLDYNVEAWRR